MYRLLPLALALLLAGCPSQTPQAESKTSAQADAEAEPALDPRDFEGVPEPWNLSGAERVAAFKFHFIDAIIRWKIDRGSTVEQLKEDAPYFRRRIPMIADDCLKSIDEATGALLAAGVTRRVATQFAWVWTLRNAGDVEAGNGKFDPQAVVRDALAD